MKQNLFIKLFILTLLISSTIFAQKTIHLSITDQNQEALIGASVLLKGTSTGTVSDIDGVASLKIDYKYDEVSLAISYIGFPEKTINLKMNDYHGEVIDVVMRQKPISPAEKKRIAKTQEYINSITSEKFLKRETSKAGIKRKATFLSKTEDAHKYENRAPEVTIFNLEDEVSIFTLNRIPEEVKNNPDMFEVAWEGYTNAIENLMDTPSSAGMRDDFGPNLKPRYEWIIKNGVNATSIMRQAIHDANLENCKIKNKIMIELANETFVELKNDINYQIENVDLVLKPYTTEHPYSEPLGIKATYTFLQGKHESRSFDVYYAYNKEKQELEIQKDMACFEIENFLSYYLD